MKRLHLTVLAAFVIASATPAAGADNFGQRLRAVATQPCGMLSQVEVSAACNTAKYAALNAYGQWSIMQMLCSAPLKKYYCKEKIIEFEATVKRSILGD